MLPEYENRNHNPSGHCEQFPGLVKCLRRLLLLDVELGRASEAFKSLKQ